MSILKILKFTGSIADDAYKATKKIIRGTSTKCKKLLDTKQERRINDLITDTFQRTNAKQKNIQKQLEHLSRQDLNLDKINELKINNVRFVGNNSLSGATFELRDPQDLLKLKEAGIKRIVDFRSEASKNYEKLCKDFGFEYIKLPLDHTRNMAGMGNSAGLEITNDFVKSLKKYFTTSQKGNVYQGCRYGIDRTNLGLTLNYLLNPQKQQIPRLLTWGDFRFGNIVNRTIKTAKKIAKKLTPEQIKELGLSDDYMKILNERIYDLRNANGVLTR